MTLVGALGSPTRAHVDERGRVTPEPDAFELDWWIGAEDRRHHPAREVAVRQHRLAPAPAVETAMRVPGGDAVQRVFGVPGAIVIEIENASPVPFAAGFVVRGARRFAVDGSLVRIGRRGALRVPRAPSRQEAGPGEQVLVYPVPHRTRLRLALGEGGVVGTLDLSRLADASDVARGWEAQLQRGMRVELPAGPVRDAVDPARATALLEGTDVGALEDWGFDDEAAAAWARSRWWRRRQARHRRTKAATWSEVSAAVDRMSAPFLLALRSLLVHEQRDGTVALLSELPPEWLGQGLEVHDAPTRIGSVSYAVRWHGERPALFWHCERPLRLRAPGLDPDWSTDEPTGEALLAAPAVTPRGGIR